MSLVADYEFQDLATQAACSAPAQTQVPYAICQCPLLGKEQHLAKVHILDALHLRAPARRLARVLAPLVFEALRRFLCAAHMRRLRREAVCAARSAGGSLRQPWTV